MDDVRPPAAGEHCQQCLSLLWATNDGGIKEALSTVRVPALGHERRRHQGGKQTRSLARGSEEWRVVREQWPVASESLIGWALPRPVPTSWWNSCQAQSEKGTALPFVRHGLDMPEKMRYL